MSKLLTNKITHFFRKKICIQVHSGHENESEIISSVQKCIPGHAG